jgi:6-pyruvoyltetrahydropterin/6-carboxytetrahydropterin synthase
MIYGNGMFIIEKIFTFEAAHELIYHDGKCRTPHGHSYVLTVTLHGQKLHESGPKHNMVIDFYDISQIIEPMIAEFLDHKTLNKTLNSPSPTAEFIAQWIYEKLKPQLPTLYSITVQETASNKVTYIS